MLLKLNSIYNICNKLNYLIHGIVVNISFSYGYKTYCLMF